MEARDVERMRFVAARYGSLQGLRSVLLGSAFVGAFGVAVLTGGWPPAEESIWIPFGAALVLVASVTFWLDRFYAERFGRTVHRSGFRHAYAMPAFLMLALFADQQLTHGTRPSVFFLGYAALAGWVAIRDFRYRAHHIVNAAAGVVASLTYAAVNAPGGTVAAGLFTGLAVIGVGMIVTGLLDHRLLAGTLRRTPDCEESSDAHTV